MSRGGVLWGIVGVKIIKWVKKFKENLRDVELVSVTKPPLIVSEPPLEPFEHLQGSKSRPIPPKGLESILRVK